MVSLVLTWVVSGGTPAALAAVPAFTSLSFSVAPPIRTHPGPLGQGGVATPIGRAALLLARRLRAGQLSGAGAPPSTCTATSPRLLAHDILPHFSIRRRSPPSPSSAAAAECIPDLGDRCFPSARAGVPRLSALYLIGSAMAASWQVAAPQLAGVGRRRIREDRKEPGACAAGEGQTIPGVWSIGCLSDVLLPPRLMRERPRLSTT